MVDALIGVCITLHVEVQGRLSLESGKVPLDEVTICSCQPHKIKKEINQEFEDVWKELVVGTR